MPPKFPERNPSLDIKKIYEWLDEYLKMCSFASEEMWEEDERIKADLFIDILSQFYVKPCTYLNYYLLN